MKSQGSRSEYAVMSYAQVGKQLGISAMRVCQLEKKALKKLRKEFEARELRHIDASVGKWEGYKG